MRIRPKKFLGQVFLRQVGVLEEGLNFLELDSSSSVLEIGAGQGNVTKEVLKKGAKALAIEIDPNFEPSLRLLSQEYTNLTYLIEDALKISWDDLFAGPYHVFSSVPYYIAGPLLARLLLKEENWQKAVLLLQKELRDRIISPPGKNRSSLSIITRYRCELIGGPTVSKKCFYPVPKVDSAFIFLKRRSPYLSPPEEELFFHVVQSSFKEKRKTLLNNLSKAFPNINRFQMSQILLQAGVEPRARAESLELPQFLQITDQIRNVSG